MNEEYFRANYLLPFENRLNDTFIQPLPGIEGLEKCGDFIVQSELGDTYSTNMFNKYIQSNLGIRLIDIYKNTQHKGTGFFVSLVGTLSLVKAGYPFLLLDASVRNINFRTAEMEDVATRVSIHLPQADLWQSELFFRQLCDGVEEKDGISYRFLQPDEFPSFWGQIWGHKSDGINLDIIRKLRGYSWSAYENLIGNTQEQEPFDYKPLQEYMIFHSSIREHLLFKEIGLSVPIESQAAFFSVMVSGV